jgi:hypothetical protein
MKPPSPHLSVVPEPGDEDPELERYLGAARQLAEPDAQSRARVARALNAALPPAAPLPAFGVSAPSSSAPSPAARVLPAARPYAPWLAVGAIVIGGLGFGLGLAVGRSAPAPAASAAAPATAPAATSTSSVAADAPPESAVADDALPPASEASASVVVGDANPTSRSAPAPLAPARRATPRVASSGTPGAEAPTPGSLDFRQALERLRRARTQLQQGHATASLLLLSELDRDAGELLFEERAATRVLALCATGQTPAARATAEQLARRNPRSIYLRRLTSSCVDESATEANATPIEGGAGASAR